MLASEQSSQRLLAGLHHNALSHPLPELRLCGPKLFPVAANHERRFLFAFLLLVGVVCAHVDTPRSLRNTGSGHTQYPEGKPLSRGSSKLSNRQTHTRPQNPVELSDSTGV